MPSCSISVARLVRRSGEPVLWRKREPVLRSTTSRRLSLDQKSCATSPLSSTISLISSGTSNKPASFFGRRLRLNGHTWQDALQPPCQLDSAGVVRPFITDLHEADPATSCDGVPNVGGA